MFRELIYLSPEADCFAIASHLFDNDPARVKFFTPLQRASVLTQNYVGGMEADEPDLRAGGLAQPEFVGPPPPPVRRSFWGGVLSCWPLAFILILILGDQVGYWFIGLFVLGGLVLGEIASRRLHPSVAYVQSPPPPTPTLAARSALDEVLAEHRKRVQWFVEAGHAKIRLASIDDFVEGQRVYSEHPLIARKLRGVALVLFPLKVALLALPATVLAFEVGVAHPATGAALLTSCLVVILFRHYGFPLLAALNGQSSTEPQQEG
jgi:hypothetical protein